MALMVLRYVSFSPIVSRTIAMKSYYLSKAVSASIEEIICCDFKSIHGIYYIYSLMYVEPSLHFRGKANLVMEGSLLDAHLYSVCKYSLQGCMCSVEVLACSFLLMLFLFLVCILK